MQYSNHQIQATLKPQGDFYIPFLENVQPFVPLADSLPIELIENHYILPLLRDIAVWPKSAQVQMNTLANAAL